MMLFEVDIAPASPYTSCVTILLCRLNFVVLIYYVYLKEKSNSVLIQWPNSPAALKRQTVHQMCYVCKTFLMML